MYLLLLLLQVQTGRFPVLQALTIPYLVSLVWTIACLAAQATTVFRMPPLPLDTVPQDSIVQQILQTEN